MNYCNEFRMKRMQLTDQKLYKYQRIKIYRSEHRKESYL